MKQWTCDISASLRPLAAIALLGFAVFLACSGCEESSDPPARPDEPEPRPRLASTSPAATNLLLELRARMFDDSLAAEIVAVSTFDTDARVADLPRAGDYLNLDWEALAQAGPDVLIVQVSPEKLPPETKQRADWLGIEILHLQIDRLADIEKAAGDLGEAYFWQLPNDASRTFADALGPATPDPNGPATLVVLDTDFSFIAGRGNYLDDLLNHAGLTNAAAADLASWPNLDDEAMSSLSPDAVLLILPAATDAQLESARSRFDTFAPGWGLTGDDLYIVTDPYAMVPGWSVIDLAGQMRQIARPAE